MSALEASNECAAKVQRHILDIQSRQDETVQALLAALHDEQDDDTPPPPPRHITYMDCVEV